jgi:hypothetical protein
MRGGGAGDRQQPGGRGKGDAPVGPDQAGDPPAAAERAIPARPPLSVIGQTEPEAARQSALVLVERMQAMAVPAGPDGSGSAESGPLIEAAAATAGSRRALVEALLEANDLGLARVLHDTCLDAADRLDDANRLREGSAHGNLQTQRLLGIGVAVFGVTAGLALLGPISVVAAVVGLGITLGASAQIELTGRDVARDATRAARLRALAGDVAAILPEPRRIARPRERPGGPSVP